MDDTEAVQENPFEATLIPPERSRSSDVVLHLYLASLLLFVGASIYWYAAERDLVEEHDGNLVFTLEGSVENPSIDYDYTIYQHVIEIPIGVVVLSSIVIFAALHIGLQMIRWRMFAHA